MRTHKYIIMHVLPSGEETLGNIRRLLSSATVSVIMAHIECVCDQSSSSTVCVCSCSCSCLCVCVIRVPPVVCVSDGPAEALSRRLSRAQDELRHWTGVIWGRVRRMTCPDRPMRMGDSGGSSASRTQQNTERYVNVYGNISEGSGLFSFTLSD